MAETLRACTVALAQSLDDLGQYAVAAVTGTTATLSALVTTASNPSTLGYDTAYLHAAGYAVSERVKAGGHNAATGVLTIARSGWNTSPTVGQVLDVTRLFPMTGGVQGEETSYYDLVRRALRHLAYEDEISLTTVADSRDYSLGTWAAWITPERVLALLDAKRDANAPEMASSRRFEVRMRVGTHRLIFLDRGFSSGGYTFKLRVLRPAWSLVSGVELATGPVEDTQTVNVSLADVTTVGLWCAYETLAARTGVQRPAGDWQQKAKDQLAACRRLRAWDRIAEIAPAPTATEAVA